MRKLGLIAGGGGLPLALAERCRATGRPLYVLRVAGAADPALEAYDGAEVALGELGRWIKLLRAAQCEAVCMAGQVGRPDISKLKVDARGLMVLPAALAAARKGDDALLRFLVGQFEQEGFTVEGAHEVSGDLTLGAGRQGAVAVPEDEQADIEMAFDIAGQIGRLDIGQGVVVCRGLVLAVEAQEGTDAMLARCADLPPTVRGSSEARKGVLVKRAKPTQEHRTDLPTIGVRTIQGAARAGLAGVVGEAGRTLVIDQAEVLAAADRLGLFVFGYSARA